MDAEGVNYNPRTVDEVFRDFKGRRAGMIKALTTDVEEFYQRCDPEKENLCLYGFPSEQWEVNLPAEEVPPELPEPALGINFARDGMQEKDWISLVAVHSDAWLLSVSFYFGARFGFDKSDRKRLFNMINDLPTIFEVVNGTAKNNQKEKSAVSNHSSTKSKSNSKEGQGKYSKLVEEEEEEGLDEEEEDEDEHGETLCGSCGRNYSSDEFWICCDLCEQWFHGKCVRITPADIISSMAGNPKCTYCGKSVYHAEEQQCDGKIYHIQCFGKYKKDEIQQNLKGRNVMYEKDADVAPAYYRTADGSGSAKMESGSEYKTGGQGGDN